MKSVIFIFLAFFMVLRPVIPVLDYGFNYNYIVKELCENKDKPALKCNGKCHLKKQLAKASEDEKPLSQDKKHKTSEIEVLYLFKVAHFTFSPTFCFSKNTINFHYLNLYKGVCTNSTFHPPAIAV